jgi:hypothetical protein
MKLILMPNDRVKNAISKNESELDIDDFRVQMEFLCYCDQIEYINGDFKKILKSRFGTRNGECIIPNIIT